MKRIKIILITLLMALSGLSTRAQTIQMTIPDDNPIEGDIISVPVLVEDNLTGYDILSYQFRFNFNSSVLSFNSVDVLGTMSESWGTPVYNNTNPNYINVAHAGTTALSGTGTLFYLNFTCISSGNTWIYFDGNETNNFFNEGFPPMVFDDGYISVSSLPSINITPDDGLLAVGEQLQFNVSGGSPPYTWDVTNPAVAGINSAGLLTATSHGLTKVTVEDDNNITDESDDYIEIRAMKLTIPDTSEWQGGTIDIPIYTTSLSGLGIISGEFDLTFNGSILTPTGYYTTGTLLEGYSNIVLNNTINGALKISFAGTTPLSGSGVLLYVQFDISSINSGNTWIYFGDAELNETYPAKTDDGYFTMITYSNIYVSPTVWSLVAGETKQFTATGGVPPYNWATTDATVATVDGAGILTAHQSGVIQVIVTDNVSNTGSTGDITVYDTYVTLPNVNASLGTQYDMPVLIATVPPGQEIYSVQGTLSCQSPELEFVDIVTTGTLTDGWTFAKNISGNTITFAGGGTVPFTTSGAMFKVRIELTPDLSPDENAWVNIDDILLNEGFPVPTVQNGSITGYGGIVLDLKAFLEGPFNGGDMNTELNPWLIPNNQPYNTSPWNYNGSEGIGAVPNGDVVDWVMIELRETTGGAATATPATIIDRQAALILRNGDIVGTDGITNLVFSVNVTDNLYAVVWHRNHLGIMSAVPLTPSGGIYYYDFTASSGQAYLNGQKSLGGGNYGMYSGDADGNGQVEFLDISGQWNTDAGNMGYYDGDMDMDSQVNNQDKNDIWMPNEGRGDQVPD